MQRENRPYYHVVRRGPDGVGSLAPDATDLSELELNRMFLRRHRRGPFGDRKKAVGGANFDVYRSSEQIGMALARQVQPEDQSSDPAPVTTTSRQWAALLKSGLIEGLTADELSLRLQPDLRAARIGIAVLLGLLLVSAVVLIALAQPLI